MKKSPILNRFPDEEPEKKYDAWSGFSEQMAHLRRYLNKYRPLGGPAKGLTQYIPATWAKEDNDEDITDTQPTYPKRITPQDHLPPARPRQNAKPRRRHRRR